MNPTPKKELIKHTARRKKKTEIRMEINKIRNRKSVKENQLNQS